MTVAEGEGEGGWRRNARRRGDARLTTQPERLLADVDGALSRAGCVAAEEEAGSWSPVPGGDAAALRALAERRLAGEPLAWITGHAPFGDHARGPPRGLRPPLAEPGAGPARRRPPARRRQAIDLCTGSGAIAAAVGAARPGARVVATDNDARAVACARANGVETWQGDLFGAVPASFAGATDVVVAVVPYVPSPSCTSSPATRSRSRTPPTTTAVRTAPSPAPGRRRGARTSCARVGRCCSRWAATRPSCSAPCSLGTASPRSRPGPTRTGTCGACRRPSADLRSPLGGSIRRSAPGEDQRHRGAVHHVPAWVTGEVERQRGVRGPHHVGHMVARTGPGRGSWSGSSPPRTR